MTHPTDALRLVPIEPTFEMLDAGAAVLSGGKEALDYEVSNAASVYEAMISAAPASPLPEGGGWQGIDLDALEKLAARIKSAGDDRRYPRFSDMEAAGIGLEALIAELKAGRAAVEELLYAHTDKSIAMGEAFLARNGKGERQ